MTTFEDEQAEVVAVQRLQDLGLSQYEAQTLVNLVRLGTGTAKEIARLDDVPRTRVYEAAEGLHEKGFVDVQHGSPRKFTVASKESLVRSLTVRRENTLTELTECLDQLTPVERQRESFGVWTVTDRDTVATRVDEFLADATDRIVYMTVDDLLIQGHLDRLAAADDDGVEVFIAGVSANVEDRVRERVPSATTFDTLWEWEATPAGRLLITDEEAALVSAFTDESTNGRGIEETAIWGRGEYNSLVVVLRAIFTWRLDAGDLS